MSENKIAKLKESLKAENKNYLDIRNAIRADDKLNEVEKLTKELEEVKIHGKSIGLIFEIVSLFDLAEGSEDETVRQFIGSYRKLLTNEFKHISSRIEEEENRKKIEDMFS